MWTVVPVGPHAEIRGTLPNLETRIVKLISQRTVRGGVGGGNQEGREQPLWKSSKKCSLFAVASGHEGDGEESMSQGR